MSVDSIPELTNEFVSKLIGKRVKSFTCGRGSAPGDNYTTVIYGLKCTLDLDTPNSNENSNGEQVIYGIVKCYPSHPARQQHLNQSNTFWKELNVYKLWIPTLKEFQSQELVHDINLPFPPFISGEAINFEGGTEKENEEMLKRYEGKVMGPFDVYIMLVDMKNTFGFRLANRMIGLGLEEMNLIMREYAKIHALSWAYKVKHGIDDLSVKFPFLKLKTEMDLWMQVIDGNLQNAYDALSGVVNPETESPILNGLSLIKTNLRPILEAFSVPRESGSTLERILRIPIHKTEEQNIADELLWQVVVHGDCWINNLLFRHHPDTKKAVELILIDHQMMREGCPTSDLTYAIYTSTTSQLRGKHLKYWLWLYSSQFMFHCDALGVPYLPGFNYESLIRRFHRSKLIGLVMGVALLPLMLKDVNQAQYLDSYDEGDTDLGKMMITETAGSESNSVHKERLYTLVKEMYEDGVI